MRKIYIFIMFFLLVSIGISGRKQIRVACVGNSVTYGAGLTNRDVDAYPVKLATYLGENYDVRNFGKSGSTLLKKAYRPYDKQKEFRDALSFRPDIVVIHLGLNDTDPRAWPEYKENFISDYRALIDSFRLANPNTKIWICKMTPIGTAHKRFRSGTRDWHAKIQKAIERVALGGKAEIIDLYEILHQRPDLFPDALHPNAEGCQIIAKRVYSAITGNYGGLSMPNIYSDSMVVQRDVPLNVKGFADEGDEVIVEFAGQKQKVVVGNNGKWSVCLKPISACTNQTLKVSTKKRRLIYKGVSVGEVWLCSGQSNMEFKVKQSSTAREDIAEARGRTNVRLFSLNAKWETNSTEWDEASLDSVNKLLYFTCPRWTRTGVGDFSAIAYRFAAEMADSLGVTVGVVCNAVGGATIESWIDRSLLEWECPDVFNEWKTNDFFQPWVRERALLNIKKSKNSLQRHPYMPSYLFESSMLGIDGFSFKGVLWYQGESNAHNIEHYANMFPLLEKSWRNQLKCEDLAFYMVQLSSINRNSWPAFRDMQRRLAQREKHTFMVVSSDLGDSLNVHPQRKREVAHRLVCSALHNSYDRKNITSSGPMYIDKQEGKSCLTIKFSNAKGMKAANGNRIIGFEVAGEDGIYFEAESKVEGNCIVLSSKNVAHPVNARYAWQAFTRANLVNSEGMPASTFITEPFFSDEE